jgi:hypothetical protein
MFFLPSVYLPFLLSLSFLVSICVFHFFFLAICLPFHLSFCLHCFCFSSKHFSLAAYDTVRRLLSLLHIITLFLLVVASGF